MILDNDNEFADATTIPTATGKGLVGDVLDLTTAQDIGSGEPIFLVIQVETTVTSAGAATVAFILASDAQAAIATDGTATEHIRTAAIPKESLVAGYQIAIALPPESPVYERYVGVLAEVGTAALTAGKINAFLAFDAQGNKKYPNAI